MIIIYLLIAIYIVLLLKLSFSWNAIPVMRRLNLKSIIPAVESEIRLSVIIPVRNEEKSLPALLQDLNCQSLPCGLFEVIVVDDHSTDGTVQKVKDCQSQVNFQLRLITLTVPQDFQGSFKKKAIDEALKAAKGEVIITTDGDCRVGNQWLETYYSCFQDYNVVMLCGPVTFHSEKTWFEHLQTIEFAALIGTGAAMLQMGIPSMCNAANMAYLKSAYEAVKGYEGVEHIHSGDDEFLMHKIFREFPGKVAFAKSPEAIVYTLAQKDLQDFIQQRKRWASKWKYYKDIRTSALAIFIFLVHLSVLITALFFGFGLISPAEVAVVILLKLYSEYIFLRNVLGFLGKRFFALNFVSLGILYSVYAVYIGLTAQKGEYLWKGRTLKVLGK